MDVSEEKVCADGGGLLVQEVTAECEKLKPNQALVMNRIRL